MLPWAAAFLFKNQLPKIQQIFKKTPEPKGLPLLQQKSGYGKITNCIIIVMEGT